MSDPVLVIARARVLSGERDRFIAAARDCIAATRREQGCLGYDICENLIDPGHFVSVESWRSALMSTGTCSRLTSRLFSPSLGLASAPLR